jgi:HAD superfamily phosphoserine phosphatase-like hydrolase
LKSAEFVTSVLKLQPKLAVFDCDGTLWAGDAGEGFFDWELRRGLVSPDIVRWARARYAEYKEGRVDEDLMCSEMVTMHRGLAEEEVQRAATQFFKERFRTQIFPEMHSLVDQLRASGCDVWAVSSSNEWVIRAGMKYCGVGDDRILASSARVERGRITGKLIRVPTGPAKPAAITEVIGRRPDAAFGNSRWDTEMLAMAEHAFAVNPNPDFEQTAQERGWKTYHPEQIDTTQGDGSQL